MKTEDLPVGSAPPALEYPHFPTRWQTVLWRNWNLVHPERIAAVLCTTLDKIMNAAEELGLIRDDSCLSKWAERGFLTIIRRNWDLLPYPQLLTLLEWDADKLAFVLKEDDFMWVKMGHLKPQCREVCYEELTEPQKRATAALRENIHEYFGGFPVASDRPFEFLTRYGGKSVETPAENGGFGLKMIYSYSAVYGDPLLDDKIDPYPDGLLADYAAAGVNAVWLQGTLYTLIPWLGEDQPFSSHWQVRLENLRKLAERAAKYGISVYLYMNEPRNMPAEFFNNFSEWRGAKDGDTDNYAMCTSVPAVLEALGKGIERLFREVPNLGGIFTITMSENLTHCKSRWSSEPCPRCADRSLSELVVEVNKVISGGAKRANPDSRVLTWTWGWFPPWDIEAVNMLPDDITLMAVSESFVKTDCLGVKGEVIDYSISKPGPGPVAERLWNAARERGLKIMAKVQFNSTWELSAVPYIPVPGLVERHLKNLRRSGVTDLMLSWTLGGYPGGNLELLKTSKEQLAAVKFGTETAPQILEAWDCFDRAFEIFPFHMTAQIYEAPQNYGPMNLLWMWPTHRKASMIGFPYDDLESWRGGHYPEDIFEEAFRILSETWREGLEILRNAGSALIGRRHSNWQDLFNISEAAYCHFRSTYLQICFVRRRNSNDKDAMLKIIDEEIGLAQRLYEVIRRDSRIGFEASNHYFYVENDLKEKVLNCLHLRKELSTA